MHFWSLKYVSMHWYFQMSSALWPFLQTLFTAKWFESQWHFMKHNLLAQVLWIAFITISYFHLTRTISPRLNLKPFIKATSLCCFLHKQQRQINISPMQAYQISVFHKGQTQNLCDLEELVLKIFTTLLKFLTFVRKITWDKDSFIHSSKFFTLWFMESLFILRFLSSPIHWYLQIFWSTRDCINNRTWLQNCSKNWLSFHHHTKFR